MEDMGVDGWMTSTRSLRRRRVVRHGEWWLAVRKGRLVELVV